MFGDTAVFELHPICDDDDEMTELSDHLRDQLLQRVGVTGSPAEVMVVWRPDSGAKAEGACACADQEDCADPGNWGSVWWGYQNPGKYRENTEADARQRAEMERVYEATGSDKCRPAEKDGLPHSDVWDRYPAAQRLAWLANQSLGVIRAQQRQSDPAVPFRPFRSGS